MKKIDTETMREIEEAIELAKTLGPIEDCPVYQDMRARRREMLKKYDNSYRKFVKHVMSLPRELGVNYIDKPLKRRKAEVKDTNKAADPSNPYSYHD